jgi:UDP-sugar transporter A1/2/3
VACRAHVKVAAGAALLPPSLLACAKRPHPQAQRGGGSRKTSSALHHMGSKEEALVAGAQTEDVESPPKGLPQPSVQAKAAETAGSLKALSLVLVTLQTTVMVVLTRFTRVGDREAYSVCTMVIMTELLKLVFSVLLLAKELDGVGRATNTLRTEFSHRREECLKLLVPAGLYFCQNNVLIFAVTNLDTAVYQVCYQMKLVVTAVLSVLLLGRSLSSAQWLAVLLLCVGIVGVNMSAAGEKVQAKGGQNAALGLTAVFFAAFTSGMAGVYFEKLVKGGQQSVWARNFFLALFSLAFGAITMAIKEPETLSRTAFFRGYDRLVVTVVVVNAAGGMIVAMVIKYADNILKGFATGISTLLSTLCSIALFGFEPNLLFVLGAAVVIFSTFMYSSAKDILPTCLAKLLL